MATLDPTTADVNLVLSEGNLRVTDTTGTDDRNVVSTNTHSFGKFYWEVEVLSMTVDDGWCECGMVRTPVVPGDYIAQYLANPGFCVELSDWGDTNFWMKSHSGDWFNHFVAPPAVGQKVHFAVDLQKGHVWVRRTGTSWLGGGDPVSGTTPTLTFIPGSAMHVATSVVQASIRYNFGASAFEGDLPTGFTGWDNAALQTPVTWNPDREHTNLAFSAGNLTLTNTVSSGTQDQPAIATVGRSTGKWYFEILVVANESWVQPGLVLSDWQTIVGAFPGNSVPSVGIEFDSPAEGGVFVYRDDLAGDEITGYGTTAIGQVIGLAVDADTGNVWVRRQGQPWIESGDPVAGTNPTYTFPPGTEVFPAVSLSVAGTAITGKFSDSSLVEAPPEGFEAWEGTPEPLENPTGLLQTFNETEYMVWLRQPNWAYGVVERLEWKTDVLTKVYGKEERRSLRQSPRREMEFKVALYESQRRLVENQVFAWGVREWLMPLWWEGQTLTTAVVAGALSIAVKDDSEYRDFEDGGLAILHLGGNNFEIVGVDNVTGSTLTLTNPTTVAWPVGTRLYPVKTGRITAAIKATKHHSELSEATISVEFTGTHDWTEFGEGGYLPEEDVYTSVPVIAEPPDDGAGNTYEFSRMYTTQDSGGSPVYVEDLSGVTVHQQSHRWTLDSKYKAHVFRRLMYYMRGKHRKVWLPTFRQDLQLIAPQTAGATSVSMEYQGYSDLVDVQENRKYVAIRHQSGAWQYATILGADNAGAGLETLVLNAGLAENISGQVLASFMVSVRCNSDSVEIMHHHEDLMECGLTFRSVIPGGVTVFPEYTLTPIPCALTDLYFSYITANRYNEILTEVGYLSYSRYNATTQAVEEIASLQVYDTCVPHAHVFHYENYLLVQWFWQANDTGQGDDNSGDHKVGGSIRAYKLTSSNQLLETGRVYWPNQLGAFNKFDVYTSMAVNDDGYCFFIYRSDTAGQPYRLAVAEFMPATGTFIRVTDAAMPSDWLPTAAATFYQESPHVFLHNGYVMTMARHSGMNSIEIRAHQFTPGASGSGSGALTFIANYVAPLTEMFRPPFRRPVSNGEQIFVGGNEWGTLVEARKILTFNGTTFGVYADVPITPPTVGGASYTYAAALPLEGTVRSYFLLDDQRDNLYVYGASGGVLTLTQTITNAPLSDGWSAEYDLLVSGSGCLYMGTTVSTGNGPLNGIWQVISGVPEKKCDFVFGGPTLFPSDLQEHPQLTGRRTYWWLDYASNYAPGAPAAGDPTNRVSGDNLEVFSGPPVDPAFNNESRRQILAKQAHAVANGAPGTKYYFEIVVESLELGPVTPTAFTEEHYLHFGLCPEYYGGKYSGVSQYIDNFSGSNQAFIRTQSVNSGSGPVITYAAYIDTYSSGTLGTPEVGDVFGFVVDSGSGKLWVHRNGEWINSQDPTDADGLFSRTLDPEDYSPVVHTQRFNTSGATSTSRVRLRLYEDEFEYLPTVPAGVQPWSED